MIIKFFKSNNNPKATIDYLSGRNRDREKSKILQGDIDLSLKIAESLEFSNRYTAGCISFEEENIPEEHKLEIMDHFENTFFAGLDKDQYNITWIEHTDKDRLELNFFIPNVELGTQKRLQPYFDRSDRPLAENFKQTINHDYHLSDPDAPEKKQSMIMRHDLPKDKKEALSVINDGLATLAKAGEITNRDDVIQALEKYGFEVVRQTSKSISIKTDGQNLRLKGAFYEQDFRFSEGLSEEITKRNAEHEQGSTSRYRTAQERLNRAIENRKQIYSRKYPKRTIEVNQKNDKDVSATNNNRRNDINNNANTKHLSRVSIKRKIPGYEKVGTVSRNLPGTIKQDKANSMQNRRKEQAMRRSRQELYRQNLGRQLQDNRKELEDDANSTTFRDNIKRVIETTREHARSLIEKIRRIGTRERIDKTAIQSNNGTLEELKRHTNEIQKIASSQKNQHRRGMSL